MFCTFEDAGSLFDFAMAVSIDMKSHEVEKVVVDIIVRHDVFRSGMKALFELFNFSTLFTEFTKFDKKRKYPAISWAPPWRFKGQIVRSLESR
jgi:hypothetical protein